ncbi:MerR family transcriptional regulator [Gemella cuniculi]|uniref:MerR family transcriptional regulator n=1 Tax=Gemella cuniculi TaxID=150240 RepID=UPI000429C76D|nr:MerR family transcriptional regulator [Gemella cuniculi]
MYLIKRVSEISGVSVRTLHYYDQIKLLSPQKYENGYRYYSEEDISTLQTILFYKYLGFSLKQIKKLLIEEDSDLLIHLKKQLHLMQNEKNKLLTLIDTLEKTIISQERKIAMTAEEKFTGFTYQHNQKYTQAAIDKYGEEVIRKAIDRQKGKEKELTDGFNKIFFAFAENMEKGVQSVSQENIKLAHDLHKHICEYSFDCSYEVFGYIGWGYVKNPEFKQNMDKFGEGVAQYVCDAIQEYVKKESK